MTARVFSRTALSVCVLALAAFASAPLQAQSKTQEALASHFVRHAANYCGYELSARGTVISQTDYGADYANDRTFADRLWHGTFACKKAYIGASCTAARWSLCQRTFAEYGPEGALVRGLLKPIIHK